MTTLSIEEIAAINRREERIRGTLQWRLKYKAWRTVEGVDFMRRTVQEGNESAAAHKASMTHAALFAADTEGGAT